MAYNFTLSFVQSSITFGVPPMDNVVIAGFSECSGLEMTLEVEEHQQGGDNGRTLKFPTRVTWPNLKLRRGMTLSDNLWKWHASFAEGHGIRYDGTITLKNELQEPVKIWRFLRGLPVKYGGPSLNASQSAAAIEELEIGHEGLSLVSSKTVLTQDQAVDTVKRFGNAIAAPFQEG